MTDFSWSSYFDEVCAKGPSWMDYSNERVQLQTFGAVIEAIDRVVDRRVLDIGCGRGQLCLLLKELGAKVTGVDQVASAVAKLRESYPSIEWHAGNILDVAFRRELGTFDAVTMLEVIQYLPAVQALQAIWDMLSPGGRVIVVFPNERCPIVKRTVTRFEGHYKPPELSALVDWASSRADAETWAMRGFRFQTDQRLSPYALLPWTSSPDWDDPPNRIELVVQKKP
jgi:SAM-dependent methyltransferase